jgi:glyoxylase-like metal-dependent hydrolase (beta-lactamase superfamily II)
MTARIEKVVTDGTFTLDGGTWDVQNNVWLLGDDDEVVIIDAAHDPDAILDKVGGRRVGAILLTHGHNDHINAAPDLAKRTGATIWLHPADAALWGMTHSSSQPGAELHGGQVLTVAGVDIQVLHTPGHSPGAVCFSVPELGTVFTGDTLFAGGPGATGRSFSDFPTIIDSVSRKLLTLPDATVVHTGHGDDTTIGTEAPNLDDWVVRGH